jgi:4'-phosphopantetheinyl transferase
MSLDTYLVKIDRALGKEEFDRLLTYVSDEKRDQIHRFYHFDDSQRALIGNVLARYAICSKLNIKNQDIVFGKNEYGKPLLLNSFDIDFNISHSGYWVACAISNNSVGIDVEVAKAIDFEIAKRFFSKEENTALLRQPADERLTYFYKIWTIKESYIKEEGKGLNIPLDSFTVDVENNTIRLKSDNSLIKNSIYHSVLDNRSVYAICSKSTDLRHETVFSTEQFFEEAVSVL